MKNFLEILVPKFLISVGSGGQQKNVQPWSALLVVCLAAFPVQFLCAQGAAFTYQGRLTLGGTPASGNWDMQFKLFDASTSGLQIGGVVTLAPIPVNSGLFTVTLDFGSGALNGNNRWIEIGARTNGSSSAYAVMVPRASITPAPYATVAANGVPPGSLTAYLGATAPPGWLLCDGSTVSRTNFAALFAVIGITAGSGDGTTTFKLPDLRGRVPMGAGQGPSLSNRTLGLSFGEELHTLSGSEMPSHAHSINLNTSTTGAHTHTFPIGPGDAGSRDKAADGDQAATRNPSTSSAGNHSHSVTGTSGFTGGNAAFNIIQPSFVVNFIIKH